MTFKEFYYYSLQVEAREEREWMRQSTMMSLHANLSGSKKRFTPDDFNPFSGKPVVQETPSSGEDVDALRERILARRRANHTEE